MRLKIQRLYHRVGLEFYWYLIILGLLVVAILFFNHLRTGLTPQPEAFKIPVVQLPVFWYGIFIVGGIILGALVTSKLAEERAKKIFNTAVSPSLQAQPLSDLNLSEEIQAKLEKNKMATIGRLLYQWGCE